MAQLRCRCVQGTKQSLLLLRCAIESAGEKKLTKCFVAGKLAFQRQRQDVCFVEETEIRNGQQTPKPHLSLVSLKLPVGFPFSGNQDRFVLEGSGEPIPQGPWVFKTKKKYLVCSTVCQNWLNHRSMY
jgi:hypothetical protein